MIRNYLKEVLLNWLAGAIFIALFAALLVAVAIAASAADQLWIEVWGDDEQRRQSAPRHYEGGWNSDEPGSYFDFGGGVQSP